MRNWKLLDIEKWLQNPGKDTLKCYIRIKNPSVILNEKEN